MPEEATRYAVPERWHEWGVRRYGFHGSVGRMGRESRRPRVPRLVVCHLGGGSSVTGVLDGRSVETTMGFSPLEGVPMTTRSGSVDPGALLYLLRERALSVDELDHALEHESGLAGLSGTSGDVRDLDEGSLALAVSVHRVAPQSPRRRPRSAAWTRSPSPAASARTRRSSATGCASGCVSSECSRCASSLRGKSWSSRGTCARFSPRRARYRGDRPGRPERRVRQTSPPRPASRSSPIRRRRSPRGSPGRASRTAARDRCSRARRS